MANEELLATTDDPYILEKLQSGWSLEKILNRRWRYVAMHKPSLQVFDLLAQQPGNQMYLTEIAKTLGCTLALVRAGLRHLRRTKIVAENNRNSRVYIWLHPDMVKQYQEWLSAKRSGKSVHLLLFELLSQQGASSRTFLAGKLYLSLSGLDELTDLLHQKCFIDNGYRIGDKPKIYCRIQSGMAEPYRQWVMSEQLPQPQQP